MSRRKHRSRPVEAVKRPEAAEARRLRAAGLLAQGRSQAEVAEAVGVSRESVRRYAAAGLAAGRPSPRTPRPPRSSRRCARAPRPTGSPATCGPWSGSPRWSNASRGCAWRGRRPGGCWSGGSAGACSGPNARPGHALIDRELYLPESWTDDRPRCREAGIGDRVEFHTKPQLARRMLERALDAGVPTAWVTADEVYGQDGRLRRWLEERDLAHVLAVNRNQSLVSGLFRFERADQLAARIPAGAWRHLSAGQGARANAATPGPGWPSGRCASPAGATGCWCAAAWLTVRWPTTSATAPPIPAWPSWSRWRGCDGRWSAASSRARARPGWTTTRSAATRPGTGT
jgi:hypothetical protein